MSTNTKKRRPVCIVSAFLFGSVIAGCGHESTAKPSSNGGGFEQALAYAKCMRANGVPNFPDPQRQGNGVRVTVDVGKNANTAEMKKALDACRDKMPQGDVDGPKGGGIDSAKLAVWTKCMRAKLPKFPDPEVSGNGITVTLRGTGIKGDSAGFENARQACQSRLPGGSLRVVDQ
jgi:tRNA(Glu) U13 pseudouridine synthase TruD